MVENGNRQAMWTPSLVIPNGVSRRDFLRRSAAVGASLSSLGVLTTACGDDDQNGAARPAATSPAAGAGDGGSADEIAVEAARQFKGTTLTVTWEAGLQALDPKEVFGPEWTELTGINIEVVELDFPDLYSNAIREHVAGSGAYDLLRAAAAWIPDLALSGVITPLDDFIGQYYPPEDFDDYHQLYESLGIFQGQRYGLFDDGDCLIFYYRKDVFDDLNIDVPQTIQEWEDAAEAITAAMAPDIYGFGVFHVPYPFYHFYWRFRVNGGEFFNPETMEATINSQAGVAAMEQIAALQQTAPPGAEGWGFGEALNAFVEGRIAMTYSWAPVGRWAAGVGEGETELEFVPESQVKGQVGYSVFPGGHGPLAVGFTNCVAANSKNAEAAYLMMQYITSPRVSLERSMTPIALTDPYRLSHFDSSEYRNLWPEAPEYLEALQQAAGAALIDLNLPASPEYETALGNAVSAVLSGADIQGELDTAAAAWDVITRDRGLDQQRDAYQAFLQQAGSTVDNTIAG